VSQTVRFQVQNIGMGGQVQIGETTEKRVAVNLMQVTTDPTPSQVPGANSLNLSIRESDAESFFPGQLYDMTLELVPSEAPE
jgi:hypothetical protein